MLNDPVEGMKTLASTVGRQLGLAIGLVPFRHPVISRRVRKFFPAIIVLDLLVSITALVGPQYLRFTIDVGLPQKQYGQMILYAALASLIMLGNVLVAFVARRLGYRVKEVIVVTLLQQYIDKLMRLSYRGAGETNLNFQLRQVEYSTESIGAYVMDNALSSPACIVQLGVILTYLFFLNPYLGLTGILALAAYVFSMLHQNRRMGPLNADMQEKHSLFGKLLYGTFAGMDPIRESGKRALFITRIARSFSRARRAVVKGSLTAFFLGLLSNSIIYISFIAMVAVGSLLVRYRGLTIGELVAAQTILFMLFSPIQELISNHRAGQRLVPAVQALEQIDALEVDSPRIVPIPKEVEAWWDSAAGVSMDVKDVSFSFDESRDVLNGVSFSCKVGKTLALVGANGAGKTTICHLIKKYLAPTKGTILLRERDISEVPTPLVRRDLALMSKDPWFFDDTLGFNLFLRWRWDKEEEESAYAMMEELGLRSLPQMNADALGMEINNSLIALSAGERQKIALIRTVLRRPKLLVIDEGLSAVDVASLESVLGFIRRHLPEVPILLITHRMEDILYADAAICIEKGRVLGELIRAKSSAADWQGYVQTWWDDNFAENRVGRQANG